MKKPVVDYRQFRLSRLRDPQFSHLLLLLGWVVYFVLFFLTENLIPAEKCHVIYSPVDDMIPFLEVFVIPYVFWYLLIVITLVYFALYNVSFFKSFQIYIIITQAVAMLVYIFYPNIQLLRPEIYPRDNFLTDIVALIQRLDTPTGVCPSLHCAYSMGIASVWLKCRDANVWWKVFVVISAVLICASTMFIKQHSIVDFWAAIPVGALAEYVAWRSLRKEKKNRSTI